MQVFALKKDDRRKSRWRRNPENDKRIVLHEKINWRSSQGAELVIRAKYFSLHYSISGQHSDPSCSARGGFTSSAVDVQTSVSKPSDFWSLCWRHSGTYSYYLFAVCDQWKMGDLLLCKCDKSCRSQLAMCTISVHSYCNKRGQTSRLVAKAQIQTSYNFEKNLFKCDSYLDYVSFGVILSLHGGYLLAPAGVNSPQFFRTQNYFALCATIKFIFSTTVLLGNPAKQLH